MALHDIGLFDTRLLAHTGGHCVPKFVFLVYVQVYVWILMCEIQKESRITPEIIDPLEVGFVMDEINCAWAWAGISVIDNMFLLFV